jgi:diguanylate cyclase (GGDEF)-like protein/PAS domain S-box-containing protein
MLRVLSCIAFEHDLRLVVLAAVICALASFTAINLLHHVRRSTGQMRAGWLAIAAAATGCGIWATHFIAMLAFTPGIPSGYDVLLTCLSLVVAVAVTGVGLVAAIGLRWSGGSLIGGAIVGAGIATMHYTGMAAFEVEGSVVWDQVLVAASVVLGCLFGAIALPVGLQADALKWKIAGSLLLTVAICSLHFTAMGAATVIPDSTVVLSLKSLPSGLLAIAVALASFIIIVLALTGVAVEMRDRRRGELELHRMRGLANAVVEGLLVCDGETIVTVNESFCEMAGLPADQMIGAKLERLLPDENTRRNLLQNPNTAVEGTLQRADDTGTPVELILHRIDYAGKPHRAIAVRDLQARKQAEQHIRFLAHHDSLTGVPNRSTFNARLDEEIEAAAATGRRLAVLCFDLDRFKEVNDLFGHAAGDKMLQVIAKRVSGILDEGQMVARLSGDEFAVLLPEISAPSAAERVAQAILEDLQTARERLDTASLVTCSIGVAIYPDDAQDRNTLLTCADTALYRSKHEGRGTYRVFEAAMGAEVRDRRLLEHDLREAIPRGELRLVYQPQSDIRDGRIIGFEALLRWKHAPRGEISPSVFIPIAEETGHIIAIGEWVLRAACREAATWATPLAVAVNISAKQLHHSNFAHTVHEILFETGLSPSRLELEVTETALILDLNRALATLRRIKMLGVRIAMDDFGTGYSSLSNLRAFPFDKIKIDGSFIKSVNKNEQAATIVRAVLGLGRGLGLPVLAEGVETSGELQFLESELCQEAQGYLIGEPRDIASFRHLTHAAETLGGPLAKTEAKPEAEILPLPKVASM